MMKTITRKEAKELLGTKTIEIMDHRTRDVQILHVNKSRKLVIGYDNYTGQFFTTSITFKQVAHDYEFFAPSGTYYLGHFEYDTNHSIKHLL